jgi:hypothetical protein
VYPCMPTGHCRAQGNVKRAAEKLGVQAAPWGRAEVLPSRVRDATQPLSGQTKEPDTRQVFTECFPCARIPVPGKHDRKRVPASGGTRWQARPAREGRQWQGKRKHGPRPRDTWREQDRGLRGLASLQGEGAASELRPP